MSRFLRRGASLGLSIPQKADPSVQLRRTTSIPHSNIPSTPIIVNEVAVNLPWAETSLPNKAKQSEFDNSTVAFEHKTNFDLFRGWAVLSACGFTKIVNHAQLLLDVSSKVLGRKAVNAIIRPTFFSHFCGGENEKEVATLVQKLKSARVFPLLVYSAEADAHSEIAAVNAKIDEAGTQNLALVLKQMDAVDLCFQGGISPVKPSSVCHGVTLSKLSSAFFDARVLPADFLLYMNEVGSSNTLSEQVATIESKIVELLPSFLVFGESKKEYFRRTWNDLLALNAVGASELAVESFALFNNMYDIGAKAEGLGQGVLIDAEYYSFQPAIDFVCLQLQRRFNKTNVTFFNTFQCYLKETDEKVDRFLTLAEIEGFNFGAKLVRGAYIVHERKVAAELGRESPVHETIEETHACYNRNAIKILYKIKNKERAPTKYKVVFATHNKASVERVLDAFDTLHFTEVEKRNVHFAQLLGMADNLTFVLGKKNVQAMKLVPYGPVQEVLPYLLRRAQENSSLLGSAKTEKKMMLNEFQRRIFKSL